MKRYGDLLNCKEIDSALFDLTETQIKQAHIKNKNIKMAQSTACTFDEIWYTLYKSDEFKDVDMNGVFFDDKKSFINFSLDYKIPYMNNNGVDTHYHHPLSQYIQKDKKYLGRVFMCLVNYLPLYYNDIRMALRYNFSCDIRKEKRDRRQCRTTFEGVNLSDDKYNLPFIYTENNYVDFCLFTWKNLYHNMECLECFKESKTKRKAYVNASTFYKVNKTFSNYPHIPITNNDRWIIEKIFGVNTILTIMPIIKKYYNFYTEENFYIPILKELLKCKPIHIRVYLAKLLSSLLLSVYELNNEFSSETDTKNIFNESIANSIKDELEMAISKANIYYSTFLKCFYKYKIIPINYQDWFYSAVTNNFRYIYPNKKRPKGKVPSPHLKQKQTLNISRKTIINLFSVTNLKQSYLLNICNIGDIFSELNKKQGTKFINKSDFTYKYGILQKEAINSNKYYIL